MNCLLKQFAAIAVNHFCNFSMQYSTAVLKRSCPMLVYNDLISEVLSVISLGQCSSYLFLKLKESLTVC